MKLTRKARAVLEERRYINRQYAVYTRHIREVAWFGSNGDRCYGCKDVPIHRWEQFTLDQQERLQQLKDRKWSKGVLPYVQYAASVVHERRMYA